MRLKPQSKLPSIEALVRDSPYLDELNKKLKNTSEPTTMRGVFESSNAYGLSKKLIKFSILGFVTAIGVASASYYYYTYNPKFDSKALAREEQQKLKEEAKLLNS